MPATHAAQTTRPPATTPMENDGRVIAHFFALDTDGRIVWPFRYVRTREGVQPQRWRFGRWVYSSQLLAFMTGQDDQYVDATPQEVESWIRRHSYAWHSIAQPAPHRGGVHAARHAVD